MGADDETGIAPTLLAAPVDASESLAWQFDDSPEVVAYRPPWIARSALAASLILIAAAGGVALLHVGEPASTPEPVRVAAPLPSWTINAAPEPSVKPAPSPVPRLEPVVVESAAMRVPPPPEPEVPSGVVPVGTPDPMDPMFILNLQSKGWYISDRPLMLLRAHQICGALQRGMSPGDAMANTVATMGATPYEAQVLVATVREIYPNCR